MAPRANPATTSLAQCARTTTRVSESPIANARIAQRGRVRNVPAAEASAPMCNAWPDRNASSRPPEKEIP